VNVYPESDKKVTVGIPYIPVEQHIMVDDGQIGTLLVRIWQIGTPVTYQGKTYEIRRTNTTQEISDIPVPADRMPISVFSTVCDIYGIDDKGEETGEMLESVNADELELLY
jgi:hypothetical protein